MVKMDINGETLEVCISVDKTDSSHNSTSNVTHFINSLSFPGNRIAVIVHGDYCDYSQYVTQSIDFTTDITKICDWLGNIKHTDGGDSDECYELVLKEAQSLSWTPKSKRVLVMIGDANPHQVGYKYGGKINTINWKEEVLNLHKMNVRIFGVKCGFLPSAVDFFDAISTEGRHMKYQEMHWKLYKHLESISKRSCDDEEYLLTKCLAAVKERLKRTEINHQLTCLISNSTFNASLTLCVSEDKKPIKGKKRKSKSRQTVKTKQSPKRFIPKHKKLKSERKERQATRKQPQRSSTKQREKSKS